MVTAERLAAYQGSYWHAFLPRLEHFVRVSNMGPRRLFPPMSVQFPAEHQALVSETAFMLWAQGAQGRSADVVAAEADAHERLNRLNPGVPRSLPKGGRDT